MFYVARADLRCTDFLKDALRVVDVLTYGGAMREVVYVALAVAAVAAGCKSHSPKQPVAEPAAPTPKDESGKTEDPDPGFTRLKSSSTTLADAVSIVREDIDQKGISSHSLGARRLAFWAAGDLKWDTVAVAKNETNPRLIIKDPEASLGKRLCIKGGVIEIHKQNISGRSMFWGLLGTYGGDFVSFWAVGDTGELVAGRSARFCGVAAGKFTYENREDKESDAIEVVGLFDLPGNKVAPSEVPTEVATTAR
jgi:hypothetical protein